MPDSDISHLHSMTNCGVAANRWSRDAGDLKRRPRQLGAGPTFPRTKLPGLMRLNLGLHARYIYRIRRQKRAMLIWIKYFSNLSRNSRKALCSGWDWHQSEGMAKLTTSLNAFFRRGRVPSGSKYHPLPDFHMFEDGPVILRNSPRQQTSRLGSPVPITDIAPFIRSPRQHGQAGSVGLRGRGSSTRDRRG